MSDISFANDTDKVMTEVWEELLRASKTYKPFNTVHEGYAIIKEELDELWDEIKITHYNRRDGNDESNREIRKEAIQVAAMAIRLVVDLYGDGG